MNATTQPGDTAVRIAAYAQKVLADAPPLTTVQVDRLAAIFRQGGGRA